MYGNKLRVRSDRYNSKKKEMEEYGMGNDLKPVDLYGKCVFPDKMNPDNMKHAEEDIKDFYDLNVEGLKGGDE